MSNDIIDVNPDGSVASSATGNGFDKRRDDINRGGRPPGVKSLKSKKFREWIESFLDDTDRIERWITEVAEGKATQVVDPDPENGVLGGIIQGTDPDPAKALDIVVKLAEFSLPKQGRVLVANDPENPFMQPVLNVTIGGKRVEYAQGSTTPRDDSGND